MLEPVIENVKLWTKLLLRKHSGFVPVFTENNRQPQTACDQQRLVSKIAA